MKVCILLVDREGDRGQSFAQASSGSTTELREGDVGSGVTQEHGIEGLSRRVLPGLGDGDTEGCPDMVGGLLVVRSAG